MNVGVRVAGVGLAQKRDQLGLIELEEKQASGGDDREWRWFEQEPERSIWYPSHQQWTQPAPYDWAPLLARVREVLP